MFDFRDPAAAEQAAATEPDLYLRRREFLQRTATAAGLGIAGATLLPSETLVAEAAKRRASQQPAAEPAEPPDRHIRRADDGEPLIRPLPRLDAERRRPPGRPELHRQAREEARHPAAFPDWQGCAHPDPDHSWEGGRTQLNGGRCDGFLRSGDNDVFSISYYEKPDLPFIPHAATSFLTFDRFFCSLMGSTYPNREYMHAATSYGNKDNDLPIGPGKTGFPDTTIFAALEKAGVSNRYFFNDLPVSAFWGAKGIARSGRIEEYYLRAANGQLPHLSFVDPSFLNEGGGTSGDEHPHGDVRFGQAFMSDVVHAFMESPQYKRGALFIVYDEWGGFFDHVRPPRVPDGRNSRDLAKDFGQMGFRIPAVCVSPYVRPGEVNHDIHGFESILKLIRYRFGLRPLTRRDAYARNIGHAFDWSSKPRLTPPDLPDAPRVVGTQCANQPVGLYRADGTPITDRPKEHDMGQLLSSGYLDRLGFKYRPATPETTFRHPSKVMQASEAAR